MKYKILIRRMIKVESYISELIDELKYPEDDKLLKVNNHERNEAIKLLQGAEARVEEARTWLKV